MSIQPRQNLPNFSEITQNSVTFAKRKGAHCNFGKFGNSGQASVATLAIMGLGHVRSSSTLLASVTVVTWPQKIIIRRNID